MQSLEVQSRMDSIRQEILKLPDKEREEMLVYSFGVLTSALVHASRENEWQMELLEEELVRVKRIIAATQTVNSK